MDQLAALLELAGHYMGAELHVRISRWPASSKNSRTASSALWPRSPAKCSARPPDRGRGLRAERPGCPGVRGELAATDLPPFGPRPTPAPVSMPAEHGAGAATSCLDALWRAWELLRLDAGTGLSVPGATTPTTISRSCSTPTARFKGCETSPRPAAQAAADEQPQPGMFQRLHHRLAGELVPASTREHVARTGTRGEGGDHARTSQQRPGPTMTTAGGAIATVIAMATRREGPRLPASSRRRGGGTGE